MQVDIQSGDSRIQVLKAAIRYGIVAWVVFLGGVAYYFYIGGRFPFGDGGQATAFAFTGFPGFVAGAPFALRAFWVVMHQGRDILDHDEDGLWLLAAGLNGSYSMLVLLFLGYVVLQ